MHKNFEELQKLMAWMNIKTSVKNKKFEKPVNTWLYLET